MGSMKAQASVEMLVTVGMVLVFTTPVLLLILVASQYGAENSAIYQAQASSHVIADAINEVFVQGDGASRSILVNLPGSSGEIKISSKEVIVILSTSGGKYEAVSPVFADVSEYSSTTYSPSVKGLLPILIENKAGTVEVKING